MVRELADLRMLFDFAEIKKTKHPFEIAWLSVVGRDN